MDDALTVVPADEAHWAHVEAVFGTRGDASRCWCQWFQDAPVSTAAADANREALRGQVAAGRPSGVLAYAGAEPAGWCGVGPRPAYPRLRRSTALRGLSAEERDDEGVWSVTCFVVPPAHRRRGVARALVSGAVELARAGGAAAVEAYPVDVAARASTSSAELFHGPLTVFLSAGFREVARTSPARPKVRLELRD